MKGMGALGTLLMVSPWASDWPLSDQDTELQGPDPTDSYVHMVLNEARLGAIT